MTKIEKRGDNVMSTYDPTVPYSTKVTVYRVSGGENMVEIDLVRPSEKNMEVTVNRDEVIFYGPRDTMYEIACCLSELLREGLL